MVKESGMPLLRAAKMFGVPESTLRDRVKNRISIDVVGTYKTPILSKECEAKLTAHLVTLADMGYAYTLAEFICQASDYATMLGKRAAKSGPLSRKWYWGYKGRYPDCDRLKPVSVSQQKAICTSKGCIVKYYEKLNSIFHDYNLESQPENIYVMNEIDIEFDETVNDCKKVTVIGAGSASGQVIPPYFFMVTGLPDGDIFIRKSLLNTQGFKNYLSVHFMKYAKRKDENDYILLLYDGHRSHLSVELIDWAKDNHILLHVIPPHESCIVETKNKGVLEHVKSKYEEECSKLAKCDQEAQNSADAVTKLAKKVYDSEVSAAVLQSYFRSSGIYPVQDGNAICDVLEINRRASN